MVTGEHLRVDLVCCAQRPRAHDMSVIDRGARVRTGV